LNLARLDFPWLSQYYVALTRNESGFPELHMHKPRTILLIGLLNLAGCATSMPVEEVPVVNKQAQLACEQEALVAQEHYLAQIKTPNYTSSYSSTWAGGARGDNGKWLFDSAFRACLLHAHQTAHEQP